MLFHTHIVAEAIMAREYQYTAVFEPAEEGGLRRNLSLAALVSSPKVNPLSTFVPWQPEALHGFLESLEPKMGCMRQTRILSQACRLSGRP